MQHADKASPDGIFFEIFGEKREIKPNMRTFCRFQEATGKNPFDLRMWVNPFPLDIVTLIWCALGGETFGKSVDEVADAMDFQDIAKFNELLNRFFKKGEVPETPNGDAAA